MCNRDGSLPRCRPLEFLTLWAGPVCRSRTGLLRKGGANARARKGRFWGVYVCVGWPSIYIGTSNAQFIVILQHTPRRRYCEKNRLVSRRVPSVSRRVHIVAVVNAAFSFGILQRKITETEIINNSSSRFRRYSVWGNIGIIIIIIFYLHILLLLLLFNNIKNNIIINAGLNDTL